jgi:hypothetical protein
MALAGFGASELGATVQNATLQFNLHAYDNAPTDGSADGHDTALPTFTVGELDDPGVNRLYRGILDFTLPTAPVGEVLLSATLKLHIRLAVNAGTGDAVVYHSQTAHPTFGTNGLYNDTAYNNFAGTIATADSDGTDATPKLVTLNVTPWVLSDYANDTGSIASSFRLQIDGIVFTEDNVRHLYSFVGKNATTLAAFAPVLELQFGAIPEPSTIGLLLGCGVLAGAVALRKRR